MIPAIITRGIGFGGVNYIPTHGFTAAVIVPFPDFEIGTTRNLMPRGTTRNLMPEGTTRSLLPNGTTDPIM